MKKILIIGLALVMCMGMVFADYKLILSATVEGITEPDNNEPVTGDDETPDIDVDGLQGWLYFDRTGSGKLGDKDRSGLKEINPDSNNSTDLYFSDFDLTGKASGADALYLYIAAGENTKAGNDVVASVMYSSERGWELCDADGEPYAEGTQEYNKNVPITFVSSVQGYSGADTPETPYLSGERENKNVGDNSETITLTAAAGTNTVDSAIVAKTTVVWEQKADLQAGSYEATVAITIAAN